MDSPTRITPPGWYDDGHGQWRWWDGSQWTAHTAPLTQPTAPAVAAQARPTQPTKPLVEVKKSKLGWILAIALVVAALLGGLIGAAIAATLDFDNAPLKQTYARFLQAEQDQDCAALEEVTTANFRDDLFDDQTCAMWATRPPTLRDGESVMAFRFGPMGVVIAREEFEQDRSQDGFSSSTTIVTYTLVEQNGRWKIEDTDGDD